MRTCILGKYPPIEGGVSTTTYWLARGLAERGHEIHVVTNADEVEEMYRLTLAEGDRPFYEPRFENGGRVRVHNPERVSRGAMGYIPEANPFVSKLASLATDVVRRHQCEQILAYYYEPYAVAGFLASRWTGRPLLVKHAGSDLDRLFHVPDLATTYKEILRSADAVVTQPRLMRRFLGMGVDPQRLEPDVAYAVPTTAFQPGAAPLDVARTALRIPGLDSPAPYDPSLPAIGVYGKVGRSKGTFDLVAALGDLAREGLAFNFLLMIGRAQAECIADVLRDAGLAGRTYVVPMLPNWRVPAFVRACTAACFLERDFPVAIHGPIIPREILACGTCLVLSHEIASKQRYRDQLAAGENVLLVDPKDRAEMTGALRSVIADPVRAARIGGQGASLSRLFEGGYDAYVSGWEKLLERHRTANEGAGDGTRRRRAIAPATALASLLPDLVSFLTRRSPRLVAAFVEQSADGELHETAIRFCDFAAQHLDRDAFGEEAPRLLTALRYARARLGVAHDPAGDDAPAFAVSDRLHGQPVTRRSAWDLTPVRGNAIRIEAFDHDVSALFTHATFSGQEPESDYDPQLSSLPPARVLVLFQRSANLIPRELRIDEPTREILRACDGTRTTGEVVDHLCRHFGAETPEPREALTERLLAALDRLYRSNVVVFGERNPGFGWAGGVRGLDEDPPWGSA